MPPQLRRGGHVQTGCKSLRVRYCRGIAGCDMAPHEYWGWWGCLHHLSTHFLASVLLRKIVASDSNSLAPLPGWAGGGRFVAFNPSRRWHYYGPSRRSGSARPHQRWQRRCVRQPERENPSSDQGDLSRTQGSVELRTRLAVGYDLPPPKWARATGLGVARQRPAMTFEPCHVCRLYRVQRLAFSHWHLLHHRVNLNEGSVVPCPYAEMPGLHATSQQYKTN